MRAFHNTRNSLCFIFLIAPPVEKTEEKYSEDDKREHELVRQWRVVIEDIQITNDTSNIINPFVKFIVGGDYYI